MWVFLIDNRTTSAHTPLVLLVGFAKSWLIAKFHRFVLFSYIIPHVILDLFSKLLFCETSTRDRSANKEKYHFPKVFAIPLNFLIFFSPTSFWLLPQHLHPCSWTRLKKKPQYFLDFKFFHDSHLWELRVLQHNTLHISGWLIPCSTRWLWNTFLFSCLINLWMLFHYLYFH